MKNLVFLMKITIVSSEHFSSVDKPTYSYHLYLLNFTYLAKGYRLHLLGYKYAEVFDLYTNTSWITIIKIHEEKDNELSPNDKVQDKLLHILRVAWYPCFRHYSSKTRIVVGCSRLHEHVVNLDCLKFN